MNLLSIGKRLLPAVIVVLVIATCASMPELSSIPERLVLQAAEAVEQSTEAATPTEDEDATEDAIEQAIGDYTDGVYTGTGTGYGGEISVQVTVEGGQIVSVEILSAKSETESFFNRAKGVIDSVLLYQTWEVDVVTGATYSSNGILNAIKNALTGEVTVTETASTSGDSSALTSVDYEEPAAYLDGTYTGSAAGFGGTISVSVTIADGAIASITITSASGETASYLAKAKSVIDSILSAQSPNVDVVSGATYSSNGIINAVKKALAKAATDSTTAEDLTVEEEEVVVVQPVTQDEDTTTDTYEDPAAYLDGTYTGSAIGFGGTITVSVTVEGGLISAIDITEAANETPSYLIEATAVVSEILSSQSPNVDTVTGATYSSKGIINAVKNALAQAATNGSDADTEDTQDEQEQDTTTGIDFSALPNYGYTDGIYSGVGEGYGGDVVLLVIVSGGQITEITVVSAEDETYAYWMQAITLLDTIILRQTWEVDVVAGATFSSEGILEAVADALSTKDDSTNDADEPDDTAPSDDADEPDDTDEPDNTDEPDDTEPESSTTVTTYTTEYQATVTVMYDEDEDFDPYELTLTITVTTTVTTSLADGTTTVTTTSEITSAEYSADTTSKTNLRYMTKAWDGLYSGLLADESVDAVSGATCSSVAIIEAWSTALSGVSLGTTTTEGVAE